MAQHRIKHTDQEWFDLINNCRTSGLKVKTWCEQQGITAKALYYHTRQLRQKGYELPQRALPSIPAQKQEAVCLDIPVGGTLSRTGQAYPILDAGYAPAIHIDFHGIRIGVSDHAAQDTVINTFRALRELC